MKNFRNVLWGLVLIAIGLVWALNETGVTSINVFFDGWWTLFIIVPCFIDLFKAGDKTGNLIGLLIGVALLLSAQGVVDFDIVWRLLVPAILIAIGISMIFKDAIGNKVNSEIKKLNENKKHNNVYCATFSGQEAKFENEEFEGADLTAVFGGTKCDLKNAIINKDVVINASAIFGGIEIYVPSNVKVKIKSTPIFGGVTNKAECEPKEDAHTIYVNGLALFGGVEIK